MIVMSIDIECKSRLKKIKNKFLKIPTVPMMTPMSSINMTVPVFTPVETCYLWREVFLYSKMWGFFYQT